LRAFLFFWGFYDIFGSSYEIVTPITSYKRLVEGLYLHSLGQSPYAGSAYHQPPLLLALFYPFQNVPDYWAQAFFIVLDLINAKILHGIAKAYKKIQIEDIREETVLHEQPNKLPGPIENLPEIVAALYLFNPYTIFTCVGMSTAILNNFALLGTIYFGLKGNAIFATFF